MYYTDVSLEKSGGKESKACSNLFPQTFFWLKGLHAVYSVALGRFEISQSLRHELSQNRVEIFMTELLAELQAPGLSK